MASDESDEDKVRVHIWIYKSDYDWLMHYFGGRDSHGFSKAVRRILRSFRKQVEEKRNINDSAKLPAPDLDPSDEPAGGS